MKAWKRLGKRMLVLMAVPLTIALLSFALFEAIQESYSAEARLRVEPRLSQVEGVDLSSSSLTEAALRQQIEDLERMMMSDRVMRLLGFSLTIHDLRSEQPFTSRPEQLIQLTTFEKSRLEIDLQTRVRELQLEWSGEAADSLLKRLVKELGYGPFALKNRLNIDRIPGNGLLLIQASGESPEMSTFMVNSHCEEFIRYYLKVEKEREEANIELLNQLLTQSKLQLEEAYAKLNQERQSIRERIADPESEELYRQIQQLEGVYQEEQQRVEALRARLEQQQAQKKRGIISVRQWTSPTRDGDQLAVELGTALAHLAFVKKELETLQEQIRERESKLLAVSEMEVAQSEEAYLDILEKLREAEEAYLHIDQSLSLIARGTSRYPNPIASSFLAGLSGLTSFLLWVIWLFQVKYLRWHRNSARNLPQSRYPNDH
ncbi:MAG: hypothetical protein AAF399_19015 [Bacteroidota bacterium]